MVDSGGGGGGGGGSVKEKEEEDDDGDGGVTFPADQKFGVRIFVLWILE